MLVSENGNRFAKQLKSLEEGVTTLDNRVAALDDKVTHVIQMNSELMIQTNENYRDIRSTMDDHRAELKKSIKQIRGRYSTRCQLIGFGIALSAWTLFMAWVMWA
tara:strand:+ start:2676 stop:2990 length:315 start_codon:yes stop_codon:yes gene_type:complete